MNWLYIETGQVAGRNAAHTIFDKRQTWHLKKIETFMWNSFKIQNSDPLSYWVLLCILLCFQMFHNNLIFIHLSDQEYIFLSCFLYGS